MPSALGRTSVIVRNGAGGDITGEIAANVESAAAALTVGRVAGEGRAGDMAGERAVDSETPPQASAVTALAEKVQSVMLPVSSAVTRRPPPKPVVAVLPENVQPVKSNGTPGPERGTRLIPPPRWAEQLSIVQLSSTPEQPINSMAPPLPWLWFMLRSVSPRICRPSRSSPYKIDACPSVRC